MSDALAVAATPISLESQTSDNYGYDEIGRIIKDKMRGITAADWTLANKPREMTTDRGTVKFRYGAMNEKIYREEYTETPTEKKTVRTWYVRDASGNILSIYSKEDVQENSSGLGWIPNIGTIELDEQPLYGSNRIGIYKGKTDKYHRTQGHITFELSNHLGNVLSGISDLKRGTLVTGGKLTEYEAVVITQRDYLAFGLEMPDRSYNAATADDHRFSFNGKEDDKLIGWQDYGFRWYDKKVRRFVSVDPLTADYPWYTPYQFAGNKPIWASDLDGLEEKTEHTVAGGETLTSISKDYNVTIDNLKRWNYFEDSDNPTLRIGQVLRVADNISIEAKVKATVYAEVTNHKDYYTNESTIIAVVYYNISKKLTSTNELTKSIAYRKHTKDYMLGLYLAGETDHLAGETYGYDKKTPLSFAKVKSMRYKGAGSKRMKRITKALKHFETATWYDKAYGGFEHHGNLDDMNDKNHPAGGMWRYVRKYIHPQTKAGVGYFRMKYVLPTTENGVDKRQYIINLPGVIKYLKANGGLPSKSEHIPLIPIKQAEPKKDDK